MSHHHPGRHRPRVRDDSMLSPQDEHEWDLQERALRDAREMRDAGAATAGDGTESWGRYRLVADALRHESSAVPADLATSILDAVRASPGSVSPGLERWLLRGLFAVFTLAGLVVATLHGSQWLQAFALPWSQAPVGSHDWLLALIACIAISWSLRWLHWSPAQPSPG